MDDDQPTGEQPPADDRETARFPRPDTEHTSVLPAAGGPGEPPARWAGRAGVPAGGPRRAVPEEQSWVPDQEPRTWWAPILIVLAILVLLGLIGLGLWLATRAPAPAPSAPAAPSSAATSASPSPSPSPSTPASPSSTVTMVPVPSLAGVTVTDAEEILQGQGLNWKVVPQVSDEPPGTVVRTDPAADALVPAGTPITLYVATPAPTSAAPSSASPSASATP